MSSAKRYRVTVHAPAPATEEADGALAQLRAVLEARGIEIRELRTEEGPSGEPFFHLESTMEALSAFDAEQVKGRKLFGAVLQEAGIAEPPERPQLSVAAEIDRPG